MGGMEIFKDYCPHMSDMKWVTCKYGGHRMLPQEHFTILLKRNAKMMLLFADVTALTYSCLPRTKIVYKK